MSGRTPAAAGFRWPAEWEPHAATWLAWPHNADTWPGRLDRAVLGLVAIVRALQGREQVHIAVSGVAAEDAARAVANVRRYHPFFKVEEFGNAFRKPADRNDLREGLREAGLK